MHYIGINMYKKFFTLFLIITVLAGCSKTAEEYLSEAKQSYDRKDYNNAVALYEKACNKESYSACKILADIYAKGEIIKKDNSTSQKLYGKALEYAKISCENKDKKACKLTAALYETGLGVEKNLDISDEYNVKACKLGEAYSCYYIARLKADDMEFFLKYMDKACSLQLADGCLTAGNTYLTGFNENMAIVPKNIDTGLDYINQACIINNQYCANLADIYISGEDVFQNYNQAVKYYETAINYYKSLCDKYDDNNNACRNIDIIKAKFSVN